MVSYIGPTILCSFCWGSGIMLDHIMVCSYDHRRIRALSGAGLPDANSFYTKLRVPEVELRS